MNAHNHPRRETVSEWRTRLCAEQDAERRRTNPELAATVDRLNQVFDPYAPQIHPFAQVMALLAKQPGARIVDGGVLVEQFVPVERISPTSIMVGGEAF